MSVSCMPPAPDQLSGEDGEEIRGRQVNQQRIKKILQSHQLKVLNVGLLLYLCAGGLVFELLEQPLPVERDIPKLATGSSVGQLRTLYAGRIWNITDKLNILYEPNWTQLVLRELAEFEQRLVKLVELEGPEVGDIELELEFEKRSNRRHNSEIKPSSLEDERGTNSRGFVSNRKWANSRAKSLRRALVGALATVLTIEPPAGAKPSSQASKLFAVLYGSLGIPLVFLVLVKTSSSGAPVAGNALLKARHHLVTVPLYRISCLGTCFRWIGWLACCCGCCFSCCCFGLCGLCPRPKSRLSKGRLKNKHKHKSNVNQRNRRPKPTLKLIKTRQPLSTTNSQPLLSRRNPSDGMTVLEPVLNTNLNHFPSINLQNHHQQQQQQQQPDITNHIDAHQNIQIDCQGDTSDDKPDLGGVVLLASSFLAGYVCVGAYYIQMNQQQKQSMTNHQSKNSFLDALYKCYAMLSASKLPDSFAGLKSDPSPLQRYKQLLLQGATQSPIHPTDSAFISSDIVDSELSHWQSLTIELAYLALGLHLVAIWGQLVRLWLASVLNVQAHWLLQPVARSLPQPPDDWTGGGSGGQLNHLPHQHQLYQNHPNRPLNREEQLSAANHVFANANRQQELNLNELFLVSTQASPQSADLGTGIDQGYQITSAAVAGDKQQMSDVSFTSEPSTSLCLHHQSQVQLHHNHHHLPWFTMCT